MIPLAPAEVNLTKFYGDTFMKIQPSRGKSNKERLKKVCNQFEGYMIYYLMKNMYKTIPKSSFSGGLYYGKDTLRELCLMKLSENIGQKGAFEIGKMLYEQLSKSLNYGGKDVDGNNRSG